MSTDSILICLAILTSSFLGSWHCAAMCGPIASVMAKKKSLIHYHFGRGISYLMIGAIGGYVGSFFLKNDFKYVRFASGIGLAILLCYMGVQIFRGQKSKLSPRFKWFHSHISGKSGGIVIGLLSVFLPCGWLYSYVVAAVATQSSMAGALVMTLFWMGGLPAMSALSLVVKRAVHEAPFKHQKIAGIILVFSGVYSVASFFF